MKNKTTAHSNPLLPMILPCTEYSPQKVKNHYYEIDLEHVKVVMGTMGKSFV